MVSVFVTVFQTALSMYLTLFKKLGVLTKIYALAFVVNMVGNFFISCFGIIAAGVSTLFAYLIILAFQFVYIYRNSSCT